MADSELVSEFYALNIENWFAISMDALSIFEFVTTLDQESSSVWKRKRSGASVLLFAVRYIMLATAIVDLCLWAKLNPQECAGVLISENILELIGFTLTAVFSALRVYALCGGSLKLFNLVLLLQLCPVVVNLYGYIDSTYGVDPMYGCASVGKYSSKTSDALTYASRIPLTVGDVLVVLVTWIKPSQQLRAHRTLSMHLPLSTLLFRDGTVYFLILLVLNILEVCPLQTSDSGYVIGGLSATLPLILVNRFMLNLSQASDCEGGSDSPEHTHTISMPMFKAGVDVVGNMGESLDHGWETSESEEGEKAL